MSGDQQDPRVDILAEAIGLSPWSGPERTREALHEYACDLLARLNAARPAFPAPEHGGIEGLVEVVLRGRLDGGVAIISREEIEEVCDYWFATSPAIGERSPEHATPDEDNVTDDEIADLRWEHDMDQRVDQLRIAAGMEQGNHTWSDVLAAATTRLTALPAPAAPDRERAAEEIEVLLRSIVNVEQSEALIWTLDPTKPVAEAVQSWPIPDLARNLARRTTGETE